jgi:hypothetical protein
MRVTLCQLHLPLVVVSPIAADMPRAALDVPVVRTHELADLSPITEEKLDGKRARFRLVIASPGPREEKYLVFNCQGSNGRAEVEKTVWLLPGEKAAIVMEVEARLLIRHQAARGPFPALTEYRLMDARRVQ